MIKKIIKKMFGNKKQKLSILKNKKTDIEADKGIDLSVYNTKYYAAKDNPLKFSSARHIISVISKYYKPSSVIDMGCGNGIFLKCWQESSANEILGLDGNNIDDAALFISRDNFKSVNIPQDKSELFIANLCSFSDFILFSAAIPYQDGLNHVNCQPLKYWVDIFEKQGYACFDFIRPQLLNKHEEILSWYLQNILFFCKNDKKFILEQNSKSKEELNETKNPFMFYHYSRVESIVKQLENNNLYFKRR